MDLASRRFVVFILLGSIGLDLSGAEPLELYLGHVRDQHILVIDCGSSGSRIHVHKLTNRDASNASGTLQMLELPEPVFSVEPGLSHFVDDLQGITAHLEPLLKFAKERIHPSAHERTAVMLMATAGVRMLGPQDSSGLMAAARVALADSEFLFRPEWASVLSGQAEGVYAWFAANYVSGALQDIIRGVGKSATTQLTEAATSVPLRGVIDLGGGSMQLTFATQDRLPTEDRIPVHLPGLTQHLTLFSHSFNGFGAHSALQRTLALSEQRTNMSHESPCLHRGYITDSGVTGTGNFDQCVEDTVRILKDETTHCRYSACSIEGVIQPTLSGVFSATENFAYAAEALHVDEHASLEEVQAAGRLLCSKHWSDVELSGIPDRVRADAQYKFCFASAYMYAVLHNVFGVPVSHHNITFSSTVLNKEGSPVAVHWTIGAALLDGTRRISGVGEKGTRPAAVSRNDYERLIPLLLWVVVIVVLFNLGRNYSLAWRQKVQQLFRSRPTSDSAVRARTL